MVEDKIDIRNLNLEELNGVVSIYPWYAGARMELCRRMSELGEGAWSDELYAEAALYVASRRMVAALAHRRQKKADSERPVREFVIPDIGGDQKMTASGDVRQSAENRPKVILAGGDFFSQDQYRGVRADADSIFASIARQAREEGFEYSETEDLTDYCTETLAEIYAEQGYPEQAKEIYSKLSLRYPEKSVYFASLIEKIK